MPSKNASHFLLLLVHVALSQLENRRLPLVLISIFNAQMTLLYVLLKRLHFVAAFLFLVLLFPSVLNPLETDAFLVALLFLISFSLPSYGRQLFAGCLSLSTLVLPRFCVSIPEACFTNCTSLREILFEDINSVTRIGESAFRGCVSLQRFLCPHRVTSIPRECFSFCQSLSDVVFDEKSCLCEIGEYAFSWCSSLSNIQLPRRVERIGYGCFYHCHSLQTCSFACRSSLSSVGPFAFCECAVTALLFPKTVAILWENCLSKCRSLERVTIESGSKLSKESLAKTGIGSAVEIVFAD